MSDLANRERIAAVRARLAKARHASARAAAQAAAAQLTRVESLHADFSLVEGAVSGAALGAQTGFSTRLSRAVDTLAAQQRKAGARATILEIDVRRTEQALERVRCVLRDRQKMLARRSVPQSRRDDA